MLKRRLAGRQILWRLSCDAGVLTWAVHAVQQAETERMQAQTSGLLSAMDCFSEGIMLVNTATQSWDVLFVNDAWSRITSAPQPSLLMV